METTTITSTDEGRSPPLEFSLNLAQVLIAQGRITDVYVQDKNGKWKTFSCFRTTRIKLIDDYLIVEGKNEDGADAPTLVCKNPKKMDFNVAQEKILERSEQN